MTNAKRFKEIFVSQIDRPGAADLIAWLESTDFFTAPASTKYHGAFPGWLVGHSLNVYYELITRQNVGTPESRAVCALLHDICKANYYEPQDGGGYRVKDRFPFGHGEKSVFLISRFMRLTDEEALAIRWHMGAYDDAVRGGSRTLSAAMAVSPLVYELHAADMGATQQEQRQEAGAESGGGLICAVCGKPVERVEPCGYERWHGQVTCDECCEECFRSEPFPCRDHDERMKEKSEG